MRTSVKVKRSKGQKSSSITAEAKCASYLPNGKEGLGTSKLVRQSSMRYQQPRPAIKAYEVG